MPHQRRPGPSRVMVDGIEGLNTLYEFELSAAPSPAWRGAFLRAPPALATAYQYARLAVLRFMGPTDFAPRLGVWRL
jgi:hypothetical protein